MSSSKKRKQLLEIVMKTPIAMSPFQIENFVVRNQITNIRQIRQLFLELKTRNESKRTTVFNRRKAEQEIKILEERIEKKPDGPKKELLKIKLEEKIISLKGAEHALVHCDKEMEPLLKMLEVAAEFVDLDNIQEIIDTDERDYWVKRLSKQAALDMLTTGVVGTGNMDAIISMPEEEQIQCLAAAVDYNTKLKLGMQNIERKVLGGANPNTDLLSEGPDKDEEIKELPIKTEFDNLLFSDSIKKLK